jgi:hypothetical protein
MSAAFSVATWKISSFLAISRRIQKTRNSSTSTAIAIPARPIQIQCGIAKNSCKELSAKWELDSVSMFWLISRNGTRSGNEWDYKAFLEDRQARDFRDSALPFRISRALWLASVNRRVLLESGTPGQM